MRYSGERAIARAIRFLRGAQNADGSFDSWVGSERDLRDASRCETAFTTAFVLLALHGIGAIPAELRRRAIGYLLQWREPTGLVRYLRTPIAADYDDICLLHWLLQVAEVPLDYARVARRVASAARADGMFPTWLGPADVPGTIDPIVNVNVVRFLEFNGIECSPAIAHLAAAMHDWSPLFETAYYVPTATLPWCVWTLPEALAKRISAGAPMAERIESALFVWTADVAFALFTLVRLNAAAGARQALAHTLIARQDGDGGWPMEGIFGGYGFWGSRAMTTAVAVGALTAAIARSDSRLEEGRPGPQSAG